LSQKLDSLQKLHGEVAGTKSDLAEQLANLLEERASALNAEIAKVSAQLTKLETTYVKETKGAKTRSIVIMVFAILGSFAALGSLVTLLIKQGP